MEAFVRVRCTACQLLVRAPRRAGSHACSECGAVFQIRVQEAKGDGAAVGRSDRRPSRGNLGATSTPRGLHRRKVNRIERLRWAYVVAAAWGLSSVLIAFKIHDGRTTTALLAALMVISVVLHTIAFRSIRARPVRWSTIVALQTTLFVGLATLGLFRDDGLFLGALGISYLTLWPAVLLALAFGIAITFEIFVALSWAWVALTWWIVLESRRLEQLEDEPREVPMTTLPAPVDPA